MEINSLKFMIDVGVGIKVEHWLKEQGYEVKTVKKLQPEGGGC
jgi:hypothetical protein